MENLAYLYLALHNDTEQNRSQATILAQPLTTWAAAVPEMSTPASRSTRSIQPLQSAPIVLEPDMDRVTPVYPSFYL